MELPSNLAKLSIPHLIKFADTFAGIEVYILVNARYIKLNYSEDQFVEILRKLQQKDVQEVFIKNADCKKILAHIEASMSAKTFYDPNTIDEKRVEATEASMVVIKDIINQLGADVETIKLLKTINSRAMALLSESPSLFAYIKRFKKNCSEEFLRAILTSYVMALVIDKFPWRSEQVKEKGALAAILCDMNLEKEDFELVRQWEKDNIELPERIRMHPLEVAEKLRQRRNIIPNETLTIIETHHELPNGQGFPFGLKDPKFNLLSCIFIISQQFIEQLFFEGCNFDRRLDIIKRLQERYYSKNFEKAFDALIEVVDV